MREGIFRGKAALITGSSRGIGKAIARKLARLGSDIIVNYRRSGGSSEKQARELCEEAASLGSRTLLVQADIADKGSVKEMFSLVRQQFGSLDFLVLNAAKAPFRPIDKLLERELRQLVDTNYLGNIFCIQEALPLLVQRGGKIIFISSLGSRFFNPAYPLGSMKAAMESVIRDCAETLRDRNISVNGVCGGIVKTDSFKVLRRYWEDIDLLPEETFVEPEEIADVVSFLCGSDSRGINGQTIVVDRGISNRLHHPVKKG